MKYRHLGQTGLRISQLALGVANFGSRWGHGASEEDAKVIYTKYREAGGNLIDTASNYQFGESEEITGALIARDRNDVVLSTKYTLAASPNEGLQHSGNSRRNLVQSVEASLKRLKTDRIDLLWAHFPDTVTPIDEIARGFEDLVRAGKVLYTGFSNFPAWRVSAAVMLAEAHGWTAPAAVQFEYSLVERTADRDIIPMARAYGLTPFGWSPLGGGLLTGKYRRGEEGRLQKLGVVIRKEDDDRTTGTLDALIAIAGETGRTPGQIALAWSLHRGILPLLGPRTPQHLADNLGALEFALGEDALARLEKASAIALGAPHDLTAGDGHRAMVTGGHQALVDWPRHGPR